MLTSFGAKVLAALGVALLIPIIVWVKRKWFSGLSSGESVVGAVVMIYVAPLLLSAVVIPALIFIVKYIYYSL